MLQHIAAVSAVANGGYVVTPHIVKSFVSKDGTLTDNTEYTEKRQVISEKTASDVLGVLKNSTNNASVSGYNIASKTGTSQKLARPNAQEGVSYYIASCVSFAPAEDPQLAILIVVDEPTGAYYYGSQVAAPVIAHVLSEALPYLEIKPNNETSIKTVKVEEYKGAETDKAQSVIENAGFKCVVKGNGTTVIDQMPRVGTEISEGGTIILYTEENYTSGSVTIRDFKNMSPDQVISWINSKNLNVITEGIYNKNYTNCIATTQSIAPGTDVKEGDVVTVTFIYDEEIQ
jgi:stage V sporulation protein D (sporulation-specific penicillin-binding protein)